MPVVRAAVLAVSLSMLPALAGCDGDQPVTQPPEQTGTATSASASASGSPPTDGFPQSDEPVQLDPAAFTADVTNPWFPLLPGTRWTYREVEEGETLRVVVTVTAETREVANGVTARVVRDTVSLGGAVVEDTFDWYAQDAEGTVWYLGEDTAEFEDGEITTRGGSFEAGVDGAQAGVVMPAVPEVGTTYRQEYYEGEAEDRGEVLALGEQVAVPAGDYEGLLKTADTDALEPDVLEHKYYAEGVGLVLTVDREAGAREELLSVTRVPPDAATRAGRVPLGEPY